MVNRSVLGNLRSLLIRESEVQALEEVLGLGDNTDGADLAGPDSVGDSVGVNTLHVMADGSVWYIFAESIKGFEFTVDGVPEIESVIPSSGSANEAGFSVTKNGPSSVVGVNIFHTNVTLPPGIGKLVTLELNGIPTGLSKIQLVDDANTRVESSPSTELMLNAPVMVGDVGDVGDVVGVVGDVGE